MAVIVSPKRYARKLGKKLQVALPTAFAKAYHLQPLQYIEMLSTPEGVLIRPYQDPIEKLEGVLQGKISSHQFLQERKNDEEKRNHVLSSSL